MKKRQIALNSSRMCSEFWQKSSWLQLMTLKIIRDTKSTLLCQTGSLFKNFIPIHSWKFFVRQFFDQFSWFKITIKVSKWHKNGMNSIKMIKSSFTRKWSYKSQWSMFKKLIQKLHEASFRHSKWDFIRLFTQLTNIYRLHRIQNMSLQFSNEYLYFRSLCNYIKSQNQTHLSVTLLNDG